MGIIQYLSLMRVQQYYKNLVIFLAVFFSGNIFNLDIILNTILGFVALCLASSSSYILNDIVDMRKDRLHPDKSKRPLASGKIKLFNAVLLSVILAVISLVSSYLLSENFFILVGLMILTSAVYSFWISGIIFLDIIVISINFVLRVASGGLLNDIWISPWLIAGTFFLAFFLATGKRKSELVYLESLDRKNMLYRRQTLDFLLYLSTSMLVISYVMYTVLTNFLLVFTVPIALYMVFVYFNYTHLGDKKARSHEYLFLDRRMMSSFLLYILIVTIILYWKDIFSFIF